MGELEKWNTHYEKEISDYQHAKKLPVAEPKVQAIADVSKSRGQDRHRHEAWDN
jgi:hypothetical protein